MLARWQGRNTGWPFFVCARGTKPACVMPALTTVMDFWRSRGSPKLM
jgi:hypothetical protein